jgi:hypothetical protein
VRSGRVRLRHAATHLLQQQRVVGGDDVNWEARAEQGRGEGGAVVQARLKRAAGKH